MQANGIGSQSMQADIEQLTQSVTTPGLFNIQGQTTVVSHTELPQSSPNVLVTPTPSIENMSLLDDFMDDSSPLGDPMMSSNPHSPSVDHSGMN